MTATTPTVETVVSRASDRSGNRREHVRPFRLAGTVLFAVTTHGRRGVEQVQEPGA